MANFDNAHTIDSLHTGAVHGSTAAVTAGTVNGGAVDTAGYNSLTFVINANPHTVGTIDVTFQESADGSTNWLELVSGTPSQADLDEHFMRADGLTGGVVQPATTTGKVSFAATDVGTKKVGIMTEHCLRYLRATVVYGASIAGSLSVVPILGHPRHRKPAV